MVSVKGYGKVQLICLIILIVLITGVYFSTIYDKTNTISDIWYNEVLDYVP